MKPARCPLCSKDAKSLTDRAGRQAIIIYHCEKEGFFAFTPALDHGWRVKAMSGDDNDLFSYKTTRMKLLSFVVRKDISPTTIPVFALIDE
ncbi:hypothetical protein [Klebsiella aerogenes]|uniref:hypothetical protein n=1 Tax=Klebsiella aerogenes TaxID=548 RepID=UPI001F361FDD|nr:hypothetical protein [Klebsiella aerogenes]